MAALTLDGIAELLSEGVEMRMILVMDISHGGDVVLVNPAIKTLSEIKGKRVAAVNIPLGIYMVTRLLEKSGLNRDDIELFLMAETEQEKFYKQGKADVVVTYDPIKTKLQNLGMKVIFDSTDIPNEIFDILVVREDVYKTRKKDVCGVVKQWYRALEYIEKNPDDAAKRISLRLGVSEQEYAGMMKGIVIPDKSKVKNLISGNSPALIPAANKLISIMQHQRMLPDVVNIGDAIDPELGQCIQ
jgi:NitT/TauT family transport system substrate-binding protein